MRENKGIRTRVLLVAAMALVIASVTLASLLLVRHRLRDQITDDLSKDLVHSVATFQNLQAQRLSALDRENALLADLPSLKALMTTNDSRTIEDGAVEFWKVSGNDLFALGDREGHVVAALTEGSRADVSFRTNLQVLLSNPSIHYLVSGGLLYACSVRPLYFGSESNGTLLGFVISGFAIKRDTVTQISQAADAEASFMSGGTALATTLAPQVLRELTAQHLPLSSGQLAPAMLRLGSQRFLGVLEDLTQASSAPLQLVVLKSFDQAEQSIRRIDKLVLFAGLLALILGTLLMEALSRVVTRPLEDLAAGVRAFGVGDNTHLLPHRGTTEVRELCGSFARMRSEILRANQALLEAERLATIGRMASSVSHDLRHYLAAVYANAEFLASSRLSETERNDILSDIRSAVHGTTELIESMLVFSRTGNAIHRSPELISTLLERAIALVRTHPDAGEVTLIVRCGDPGETAAVVDARQIERAIFNLLLNACQSARAAQSTAEVIATLTVLEQQIVLEVVDNGPGVPAEIRSSLFQPFVSEGKQKGTGLGLTLAHCIAAEHGGEVIMVESRPGETVFRMSIARSTLREPVRAAKDTNERW